MSNHSLKTGLSCLIGPQPTRAAVVAVFSCFHGLAASYLRKKATSGHLEVTRMGIQIDDLAVDCIADLFARDENDSYTSLRGYFKPPLLESTSDDEVLAQSRRLVFSAVNHQLFRIFGAYDPTLRKILRNLKSAIARDPSTTRSSYQGEPWVSFCPREPDMIQSVLMPPELLELHLVPLLSGTADTRSMLRHTGSILNGQVEYAKAYPILGLASVFRRSLRCLEDNEPQESEDQIAAEEIVAVIAGSVQRAVASVGVRYLQKGKATQAVLDGYLKAAQTILREEFVSGNGSARMFFEVLMDFLPTLEQDSYGREHRTHLEYLVRVSRKIFLEEMKKEL